MLLSQRSIPCVLALIAVCGTATIAQSDIPDPSNISLPPGILLVGETAGVTDPAGHFTIVVRDLAMNPVPGANVVLDFNQCGADLRICAVPGLAEQTVSCLPPSVTAVTDAMGIARFEIRGGGRSVDPVTVGLCARAVVEGVVVGSLRVATFDLNGLGGVGPPDISYWISDYFRSVTTSTYFSRSDYDFNGTVSPADLAILLRASMAHNSVSSCSKLCN